MILSNTVPIAKGKSNSKTLGHSDVFIRVLPDIYINVILVSLLVIDATKEDF